MSLSKVHQDLLNLLKDLDTICTRNQINYSLFGGTIIGAVRHKGFIPWDDDADVIFERNEFDKFSRVLPNEFEIVRDPWLYRLKKKDSDIFIDIFIFDSILNQPAAQQFHILKLKFLQGTLKTSLHLTKGGLVGKILSLITFIVGFPFSRKFKLRLYDKLATKFNNVDDTHFIYSSLDQYHYIGKVLPKFIVESYVRVPFEDAHLLIVSNYHDYLTIFFGDYMTPPPIEKRVPQHGRVLE